MKLSNFLKNTIAALLIALFTTALNASQAQTAPTASKQAPTASPQTKAPETNKALDSAPNKLQGYYFTHIAKSGRQSIVEFFERNGKFYAYGFANVDGSGPKKDINNPNPALKERYDKGAIFVYGLKYDGKAFSGGMVYNYDDGKTYYLKITKEKNGNLTLRASIDKLGMMGESLIWTPLSNDQATTYKKEKPESSVVEESFNTLESQYR